MNAVQLIGRLTNDPTSEKTTGGTPASKTRIAVDSVPDKNGEVRTMFIDVVLYGRVAEVVAEHCQKGRQVAVTGRLELDQWQADDGTNRSRHFVVGNSVDFLHKPASLVAVAEPPPRTDEPEAA